MRTKPYPGRLNLKQLRARVQVGDVIAYGGSHAMSRAIKFFTRSSVSHVEIVSNVDRASGEIKSIGAVGSGVIEHQLTPQTFTYDGEMWLLPLSAGVQEKMDRQKLRRFLKRQLGKSYDATQAVLSAFDIGDKRQGKLFNREDLSTLFCSELVSAAIKVAIAYKLGYNPSEITPIDLCRLAIYAHKYYQLKGKQRRINGFNTADPKTFRGF